MSTLEQIAQFIRWRDWGAGKLTILWSICLYIAVANEVPFEKFAVTFVVFLVFAATQSALGYVLNDWGDRELDRKQFKRNAFNGKSNLEAGLALTLIVVMSLVTGLPLALKPGFGVLWFAWAAAAGAYSLEPIRLKTKGAVGLVTSFVAQWFLPVLLAFAAFEVPSSWEMWLLAFGLTISGATLEMAHQRYDRQRDLITKAETFAVGLSEDKVNRMYAVALLFDKIAIGLVVGLYTYALLRMQTQTSFVLGVLLATLYGVLFLATLRNSLRGIQGGEVEDPYYDRQRNLARVLHETLLNLFAPLILVVGLTINTPLYGIVLVLFLLWRFVLGGVDLRTPLQNLLVRVAK